MKSNREDVAALLEATALSIEEGPWGQHAFFNFHYLSNGCSEREPCCALGHAQEMTEDSWQLIRDFRAAFFKVHGVAVSTFNDRRTMTVKRMAEALRRAAHKVRNRDV